MNGAVNRDLAMVAQIWMLVMSWLIANVSAGMQGLPTEIRARDQTPDGHPNPKYFWEVKNLMHYDSRFFVKPMGEEEQTATIRVLTQTYLAAMEELGVQTWLMHGTLLGWWWGKKIMPWDFDADFQIGERDLFFLAAYHNMTTHYFKYGDMEKGKTFLLDVSSYYDYRGTDDVLNSIDARWIDMDTGMFVDITASRYSVESSDGEGMMMDKFGHTYRDTYIFPLRKTSFENMTAWIPYGYKDLLKSEYGEIALLSPYYQGHEFDPQEMRWIKKTNSDLSGKDYRERLLDDWIDKHQYMDSTGKKKNGGNSGGVGFWGKLWSQG